MKLNIHLTVRVQSLSNAAAAAFSIQPLLPLRMSSGFETGEIVSVFITACEIVDVVEINFPQLRLKDRRWI